MSARAVIAVPFGQPGQWQGTFVHQGGIELAAVIEELIARDGSNAVRDMVIEDSLGWLTLDGKTTQQIPWGYSPREIAPVPGYGLAYTVNCAKPMVSSKEVRWDIEHIHIINKDDTVSSYWVDPLTGEVVPREKVG